MHEGEVLSLIGPNGAGKTTAFNAITGYLAAHRAARSCFSGRSLEGLKTSSDRRARPGAHASRRRACSAAAARSRTSSSGCTCAAEQTPLAIMLGLPYVAREERELRAEARRILDFVGLEERQDELALGAALRRAAAARSRHRARREAEAAAARRAGVGHEPVGNRELHGEARRDPRARHHRAAGRARHEDGDGRVRPGRVPVAGARHRRRHARPRSSAIPK